MQKQTTALSPSLERNMELIDSIFHDVDILIKRTIQNEHDERVRFCLYFFDGMVNSIVLNDSVVRPLQKSEILAPGEALFHDVLERALQTAEARESEDVSEIEQALVYGDTILFVDGKNKAMILGSKLFLLRSITEPESDVILQGPREGFTEAIMPNLSLLRRKIRSASFKMHFLQIGAQSHTQLCVCYMENIADPKLVDALYKRLSRIELDSVLDANFIAEYISKPSLLGFRRIGYTERPDTTVANILEGRIAVLVDGSPVALTLPYLFIENFQSSEDYYVNPFYATFSRMLRIVGFFMTISVPAFYVAVVTYQQVLLPSSFMIHVATARSQVPLPAATEAFVLLLMFDILRETGIRMPRGIGTALGIVGALVIGQSVVEAGFVAAPMIIVVAFKGIKNLLIPKLNAATIILRYSFLLISSFFGLYGLIIAQALLTTHILNLFSFGVASVDPTDAFSEDTTQDIFWRRLWSKMSLRPQRITRRQQRATRKP